MTPPTPPPPRPHQRWRRLRRLRDLLRPLPDRRLPRELRPRHVGRLSVQYPTGVRDPLFPGLLQRIDTGPWHEGQAIEIFTEGEPAFDAMLAAIAGAREEILLESYIFRDDATGRRLNDALCAAAQRGVRVRVLADAFGSLSTKSEFWTCMRDSGVDCRLFHPLFSTLWTQGIRDHRKILVVDRRVGFTGGMNIGDEYGSSVVSKHPHGPWRDTHARVEGSTAWEMAAVFSEGWERSGGELLGVAPPPPEPGGSSRVLVLDARPRRGHVEAASILIATTAAARKRLWITNAYFAPNRRAIKSLVQARERGVDVRILLPRPTDAPLVRHAGHGSFGDLLAAGVRIWEYTAAILHAKTLVADDYVSLVGSSNLDFRSFRFNAECNLVILDEGVGARLSAAFEDDLTKAEEIERAAWEKRPWRHRVGDELAQRLSPIL